MAKVNPTIGRCPCPVEGCALQMDVKRIQPRSDNPRRQRKANLLYGDCPEHGRMGFDGAAGMQTYLEDNSTKCNASESSGSAPAALPEGGGERSPPLETTPQPKRPAPALPPLKTAQTSAQPAPTPPPRQSAPAKTRGLLDW